MPSQTVFPEGNGILLAKDLPPLDKGALAKMQEHILQNYSPWIINDELEAYFNRIEPLVQLQVIDKNIYG